MAARGGRKLLPVLAGCVLAGCSLVDLSHLTGGGDAADGGSQSVEGGADGRVEAGPDASNDATSGGDVGTGDVAAGDGPAPCMPGAPGPAMVRVGAFCIDSTEVTQAQYDVFVVQKAGDTSGQPAECAWNTSYLTDSSCLFDPVKYSSYPVAGVDWCDAYAYCKWAGKHLCGQIGGGPITPSGMNDATQSEWFAACSNLDDGLHAYPYGITYDPTACNGMDALIDASTPVGSLPKCNGGVHGVYDLSGNISEWEDDCVPTTGDGGPSQDVCGARGGDWGAPRAGMACTSALSGPRDVSPCWWGIRCCGGP